MGIEITEGKFFGRDATIKYTVGWDDVFTKYSGFPIRFYNGNPQYIVNVSIYCDRDKMRPEDIEVLYSPLHNAPNVQDIIRKNENKIYDVAKESIQMEFALDLTTMKPIKYADFIYPYPSAGLNSFFIFHGAGDGYYRSLVNASKSLYTDNEFLTWFMGYIAATRYSLVPFERTESYSRQLLQVIACLKYKIQPAISNDPSLLNCATGDTGILKHLIPGKVDRLDDLIRRSIEQRAKKQRKEKLKRK